MIKHPRHKKGKESLGDNMKNMLLIALHVGETHGDVDRDRKTK